MENNSLSSKVLRSFIQLLHPNQKPANTIAQLLRISVNIAYRRLNGSVPLTLDEAVKLCTYVGMSLDEALELKNEKQVLFSRLEFFNPIDFSPLIAIKAFVEKNITRSKTVFFGAFANISLGRILGYNNLVAFKLYHLQNDKTSFQNLKSYSFQKIMPNAYLDFFKQLSLIYEELDSYEFWCEDTFTSFIGEVKYYKSLGLLSQEDEKILVGELKEMLQTVEDHAVAGTKNGKGHFGLYILNYNFTYTVYLTKDAEKSIFYAEMNLLDYVFTNNKYYCDQQKKWFEGLMNYSVCISESNMKDRRAFFAKLHKKIEEI